MTSAITAATNGVNNAFNTLATASSTFSKAGNDPTAIASGAVAESQAATQASASIDVLKIANDTQKSILNLLA